MLKAGLTKAACFISAFLLALEILSGCAPVIPPEIMNAEDRLASGKGLESRSGLNVENTNPDITARKKIVLVMDSVINEEYSTAETKKILTDIQDNPDVSRDIKIDAGYIMSMISIIDIRNKDIDRLQQKNTRCLNENYEIGKALKDKEDRISELIKENEELQYKFKKLEETYQKAEKRRGIRR